MNHPKKIALAILLASLPLANAWGQVTLRTKVMVCSVKSSPCRAVANPNRERLMLLAVESLPANCHVAHSDTEMWMTGGENCEGMFKAYLLWDAYIYEKNYDLELSRILIPEGDQVKTLRFSVPAAVPNSRKVHGVVLEKMSGKCVWSNDEKSIVLMKDAGFSGACTGLFKILSGPSY